MASSPLAWPRQVLYASNTGGLSAAILQGLTAAGGPYCPLAPSAALPRAAVQHSSAQPSGMKAPHHVPLSQAPGTLAPTRSTCLQCSLLLLVSLSCTLLLQTVTCSLQQGLQVAPSCVPEPSLCALNAKVLKHVKPTLLPCSLLRPSGLSRRRCCCWRHWSAAGSPTGAALQRMCAARTSCSALCNSCSFPSMMCC